MYVVDALILDHAGNTLRHGRLEDFEPPDDLSKIDETHRPQAQSRTRAPMWVCRHCDAVNERADDICVECGEPRVRRTAVVVLDGRELREVDVRPGAELPGPTPAAVNEFFAMARWHAQAKGRHLGSAFYPRTMERFNISKEMAQRLLPPSLEAACADPARRRDSPMVARRRHAAGDHLAQDKCLTNARACADADA